MKDTDTARTYNARSNKDGATLPGVPLRDLLAAEWRDYPKWLQRSIDATGFWSKPTAPHADAKEGTAP